MHKFLKIILVLTVSIGVAAVLLQIDDDLTPETQHLLDLGSPGEGNDGYYYLMGIGAPAGEDPLEYGRVSATLLQQQAEAIWLDPERGGILDSDEILEKPEYDMICNFARTLDDADCLTHMFASPMEVDFLLTTYPEILKRYRAYLQLQTYDSPRTYLQSAMPPVAYIRHGSKLSILESISLSRQGRQNEALDQLLSEIKLLRVQMVIQDCDICRVLPQLMLFSMLDTAYILAREQNRTIELPLMTDEEKSMDIWISTLYVEGLEYYPLLLSIQQEALPTNPPEWLTHILYKPNMTMNMQSIDYLDAIKASELPPAEFALAYEDYRHSNFDRSLIRNYFGSLMFYNRPNFQSRLLRSHELSAKLMLFNALINVDNVEEAALNMPDPFYPDTKNVYLTDGGKYRVFCRSGLNSVQGRQN